MGVTKTHLHKDMKRWRLRRWLGHLAFMRERRVVYRVLVWKSKAKSYVEVLGIDGMKILK